MSEQQPARAPRVLRVTALAAVCAGVAALAAAAFIFSYAGIHSVALQAGVNSQLARGYPFILDVLLVVVLAAVLALRGAGWPSKLLAWISLLALLAAGAGADALHAAHDKLPTRTAEITVAIVPWALVLIAFVLLMAMLRQARLRRSQAGQGPRPPKWQPQEPPPLSAQPLVPGFAPAAPAAPGPATASPTAVAAHADTLRLVIPRQPAPGRTADLDPDAGSQESDAAKLDAEAGQLDADGASVDADPASLDAELAPDDPSSDEAALDPADGAAPHPSDRREAAAAGLSPAPVAADAKTQPAADDSEHPGTLETPADPEASDDDSADADMPVFHRMWSSPGPPGN
jgi:Protein of unknown function (DUF2637)